MITHHRFSNSAEPPAVSKSSTGTPAFSKLTVYYEMSATVLHDPSNLDTLVDSIAQSLSDSPLISYTFTDIPALEVKHKETRFNVSV